MVKELLQRGKALQRGHAAQQDQFMFGSGYGHVESSPIFQELTKSSILVAPNKGHQDETLVPSLVLVHCVNLDHPNRRPCQQVGDGPQLLPVRGDDANIRGAAACLSGRQA